MCYLRGLTSLKKGYSGFIHLISDLSYITADNAFSFPLLTLLIFHTFMIWPLIEKEETARQ